MLVIPINDAVVIVVIDISSITIEDLVSLGLYLWCSIKHYTG